MNELWHLDYVQIEDEPEHEDISSLLDKVYEISALM